MMMVKKKEKEKENKKIKELTSVGGHTPISLLFVLSPTLETDPGLIVLQHR